MHTGFSLHPESFAPSLDTPFQLGSDSNYPESPGNKFFNNFVNPVLEDNDGPIPSSNQNRPYYVPNEKQSFEFGKFVNMQNVPNNRGGYGIHEVPQTGYNKMAAFINQNMNTKQYNMNLNFNLFNDQSLQTISSKDMKNQSTMNTSRDSKNTSRADLNTSKRNNMSSKSNTKGNKNYQVAVNDDINLIERIEVILNQISMSHSKVCPFCSKIIDIKKCNFQNISAFFSNTSKKYYLTHFDCYLKSNSNSSKVLSLLNISEAKINSQISNLTSIETSNFIRNDKKAYFVNIEGYHPISSFLLVTIEKICNGLEHASHKNQLLYVNFNSKSTSIFDPNLYAIPYEEFRLVITIHLSHSNEDPFTFEFLMDFSQVKLGLNQKSKFAEAFYLQNGNNVIIGTEIVFDPASEVLNKKGALDSSFQSTGPSTPGKPDFGKNLFAVLKHLSISLPLKRIEARQVDIPSKTSLEENINASATKPMSQKTTPSKLLLNSNAPLFSQGQNEPAFPQKLNFSQNLQNSGDNGMGFILNKNHLTEPQWGNPGNNYFNAPLFPQNFQVEQNEGNYFLGQNNSSNFLSDLNGKEDDPIPPGLFNFMSQNDPLNIPTDCLNQQASKNQRSLYIETKTQPKQDSHSFIKEEDEVTDTPDKIPSMKSFQDENAMLRPDRTKSKGQPNLYTAVLSGKFKTESTMNSPALNKIHNQYFSEISNPGSGINTPEANTPLYQNVKMEFPEPHESTNSEEVGDSFRLEEYRGHLVEFAKTFNGSRVLQSFFPKANQHEFATIISEFESHLEELMLDSYANYMFQTLAQSCSSEQRFLLLQKIASSMVKIASDKRGTHSLQSIISLMNRDKEDELIRNTLKDHILDLSFNENGTHFVQKLIKAISVNNIEFIYKPLITNFLQVANNPLGLCVLKILISKVENVKDLKKEVLGLLCKNFEELVQNAYGNYAIQHACDTFKQDCEPLFEKILEKIVQYSNQKFSSNVVEKCISIATPEIKKKYTKEILRNDRVVELMKNKYGNYVLLKMMASCEFEDKQAIMQSLVKNVNSVANSKYRSRWLRFIEENPLKIQTNGKTHRPSQFRNGANANFDSLSRETPEIHSPMTADDWSNLRQAAVRRNSRELKEEKSQFYHENKTFSSQNNSKNNLDEYNHDNDRQNPYHNNHSHTHYKEEGRYQNGYNQKSCNSNGNYQKDQVNTPNGTKKTKNYNQKFYVEKSQQHNNKWGYNYFY